MTDKKQTCGYVDNNGNVFIADVMLPCPFCGGEPKINFIGNDYTKNRKVEIKCTKCRATILNAGLRYSQEQIARISINAWNKRV